MSFTAMPDKASGDVFTEELWDMAMDNFNAGVMRPIADSVLGASSTTITLSTISQNFTHLFLAVSARSTVAGTTANLYVRFNSDSGSNYDWQNHSLASTTVSASESIATTQFATTGFPGSTGTASRFNACELWIPRYSDATFQKLVLAQNGRFYNSTAANFTAQIVGGHWRNTAAISTIALTLSTGDFATGTRVTLHAVGDAA